MHRPVCLHLPKQGQDLGILGPNPTFEEVFPLTSGEVDRALSEVLLNWKEKYTASNGRETHHLCSNRNIDSHPETGKNVDQRVIRVHTQSISTTLESCAIIVLWGCSDTLYIQVCMSQPCFLVAATANPCIN